MAEYEGDGARPETRNAKRRSRLASVQNFDSLLKINEPNNDMATQISTTSDTTGLDPMFSGYDSVESKKQRRVQTVMLTQAAGPAGWHHWILCVTQVLLIGSLVGLAMLTVGSLMFGGAVIVMVTGVPFLAFTSFLLLPVVFSLSPVMVVVGSAALFAASGLLSLAGFGFYQYTLISWLYDYLLGFHLPGSREFTVITQHMRHVPAWLLLRSTTFASTVARYLRSLRSC